MRQALVDESVGRVGEQEDHLVVLLEAIEEDTQPRVLAQVELRVGGHGVVQKARDVDVL